MTEDYPCTVALGPETVGIADWQDIVIQTLTASAETDNIKQSIPAVFGYQA